MSKSRILKAALALTTALSGVCVGAVAQEDEDELRIRTITVTAEKREESIQDIPVAATAADAQSIREQGLADPQDLSRIAPSLDIWSTFGESQPKVTIRGVGSANFEQFTDSTAIIYFDEFPLNPTPAKLPQFFDMERVEVLRGPQGTLYGRNTTGGAINLVSRRPSGETGGYGTVTVGDYGQLDLEGAFEAPLSDSWAFRAAARRQYRDGYGTNLSNGDDVYDRDSLAGRIGLEYRGDRLSTYFKLWGHESKADGYYIKVIPTDFDDGDATTPELNQPAHLATGAMPGSDPYSEFWRPQKNDITNWGVNANVDYDLEQHTLSFVLGYLESDQDQDHDCDGSAFNVCQVDFVMDAQEFSAEARIASNYGGAFNYIAGVNYFSEDASLSNNLNSILLPALFGAPGLEDTSFVAEQSTESFAFFADGTYQVAPTLELLAGVRWTQDTKDFMRDDFAGPTGATLFSLLPAPLDTGETWEEVTYRVGFSWDVAEDANIYGTFAHGYRSGAFPSGFLPAAYDAVDPEFVDSFELGLKSFWFDQRFQLNAALFYMDFEDQQLLATPPGAIAPSLTNAGQSEIFGFEAEGQAIFSENFSLGYTLSLLDTEYQEFSRGSRDLSGQPLASAPDYKFTLSPEFTIPLWGGEGFIASDLTFSGEYVAGNDFDLLGRDVQGAYERIDARIGWRGDTFDAFIWGKNLGDELILRDWLDLSTFGFHQYIYDEPIAWGVTINKTF